MDVSVHDAQVLHQMPQEYIGAAWESVFLKDGLLEYQGSRSFFHKEVKLYSCIHQPYVDCIFYKFHHIAAVQFLHNVGPVVDNCL